MADFEHPFIKSCRQSFSFHLHHQAVVSHPYALGQASILHGMQVDMVPHVDEVSARHT